MNEERKEKKGIKIDTSGLKDAILNFLVPLVSFTVIVGLAFLVILPSMKSLPNIKMELEQKNKLSSVLKQKSENLRKLEDSKEVVADNSDKINKVLVSEEEPLPLQDQVYRMALDAGLNVSKLSYSSGGAGSTSEGDYDLVSISIGAEASYNQFITFMELVENAARFVQIKSFRYSLGKEGDRISTDMSVESPYLFVNSTAVTDDPIDIDISSSEFVKFVNRLKDMRYYEFTEPLVIPEEILEAGEEGEEGSEGAGEEGVGVDTATETGAEAPPAETPSTETGSDSVFAPAATQ